MNVTWYRPRSLSILEPEPSTQNPKAEGFRRTNTNTNKTRPQGIGKRWDFCSSVHPRSTAPSMERANAEANDRSRAKQLSHANVKDTANMGLDAKSICFSSDISPFSDRCEVPTCLRNHLIPFLLQCRHGFGIQCTLFAINWSSNTWLYQHTVVSPL